MYDTIHTHQRIDENSLTTMRIVIIPLCKSNDVLQRAHHPLTINKREGEGRLESGKTLKPTNVVAKQFDSNNVASNNF